MSAFRDLVRKVNEEKQVGAVTEQERASSFAELVSKVNDGTYKVSSTLTHSDVDGWNKGIESLSRHASSYLAGDGYKAPNAQLISDIDSYLSKADHVGQYIRANKLNFQDYGKAYQGYVDAVGYLKDLKKHVQSANDYFGQWETEEDYNAYLTHEKEYQEKLNANTYALTGEISALKALRDEYNMLNDRVKKLAPTEAQYETDRIREIALTYGDLDKVIAQKEKYLSDAQWTQKVAQITGAEDFAEKSKYVSTANGKTRSTVDRMFNSYETADSGWDDPLYEYVNGNEEAGSYLVNQATENWGAGGAIAAIFGRATDSKKEAQQMTREEVAIFNYLYATEGKEAAHDYYNSFLGSELNKRQREHDEKLWADMAKENPVGTSVFSVLTSPLKGLSYIGQANDYILSGKVDENAGYNRFSYANSAIRNQVAKQIEESGNWGKAGSFMYHTGMSMGDFLFSTAISGGNQAFTLAIMGTGAAADMTISAKDRGLSDDQAFALGTIAGAAEIVMEKIGLDALFDTKLLSGNAIKYILKNALAEGGEEIGTDLINTLADVIISQDKSQWQMAMDAYKADGKSENEAFGLALADKALELGLSGLGGALSGGALGGGGVILDRAGAIVNTVKNKVQSNAMVKDQYGGSQQQLVAAVLALDPGNAFALKMQGLIDKGKKLTGSQLNKLVQMNEAATKQGTPGAEATQQSQAGEVSSVSNVDGAQNAALRTPSQPSEGQDGIRQNQSPTFQEEVQRQFERNNGYGKTAPKIYDVDKVFSAAQSAHSSGAISEERYSEIVDTLSFAQSDYAEGNITEAEYQGMLETAMRQVAQHPGRQMAPAVSATDPMVNVDRPTWQQAQRLAKALGRDIVFYNGPRGQNGYYKDGTIYVNILADDPFAQVVSHELTHSLEGTRHYDRLKRFVFDQMARANIDLAQARKAKADQYKSHGKDLKGESEIDAEIVAEYVQTHLLTDEQAITDLVAAERNVAQRILDWMNNFARRMVGDQASRDRARLEHATRIYAKALQESRNGKTGSGTVSLRNQGTIDDRTHAEDLRLAREQTEADYREGRITDEEYDAAMDEYDRAEEERLVSSGNNTSLQMDRPVEETYDLLAYHNITQSQLQEAIERNGLLMPSVAVTNKGMTDFGEISLLFDKATIDPDMDTQNKLYGADAWTPAQTKMKMNARFNERRTAETVSGLNGLLGQHSDQLLGITAAQFRQAILDADGSIYDAFAHHIGMQTAYALERNILNEIPTLEDGTVNRSALQAKLEQELDTDEGWRQYKRWLNELSDHVIDSFDRASNQDILKNMQAQPATAKTFKLSSTGELVVPAAEYHSIGEVRANKHRLSEDAEAQTQAVAREFLDLAERLGDVQTVVSAINKAYAQRYDVAGIAEVFREQGVSVSMDTARQIQALYRKAVELSTLYFEAKPHRAVGLNEIQAAIVPDSAALADLRSRLKAMGIEVVEYQAGNRQSRINAIRSMERLKFSLSRNAPGVKKNTTQESGVKYSVGKSNRNVANKSNLKYNNKYSKVFFDENVFPPYNVSHSDSHEIAERWSRSENTLSGECRLISHNGAWYRIQAFDDMKYGYQIMEKVAAKDYDKEAKLYGTITGYESLQDSLSQDAAQHYGHGFNGNAGYSSDYDGSEHGREDTTVHRLGAYEVRRTELERNSQGNRAGGRVDRARENGPAVISEIQADEEKFSFGGSGIFSGRDAAYMDAVKRGDMETAQRMVDEAAKAAGYEKKLYHGTNAFGFTEFDPSFSDDRISIFATSSKDVAKTYSGETGRTRIVDRADISPEELEKANPKMLLDLLKKHIDSRIRLVSDAEKNDHLGIYRKDLVNAARTVENIYATNMDMFDVKKKEALFAVSSALKKMATAENYHSIMDEQMRYDDAIWDLKWLDESICSEITSAIGRKVGGAFRGLTQWLDTTMFHGTEEYNRRNGSPWMNNIEAVNELYPVLFKGVYELYGKTKNAFVIEADGANWNQLDGGKIGRYGPVRTRDVAQYAKDKGYDSVVFRNIKDNGGVGYSGTSDVYAFFGGDALKSADPITYDDDGNVIPLSERFNEEKSDIRYSFSGMLAEEENRRPAEGSYTTDEVEMQARKKGYPVLHGEQIVPFRTWVRTVDRGNYGLVTGMAPENKLLVSFHNKHDGGTADNVPIAYNNLVPVPGTYQMTKEEFASLMESEPMDPGISQLSEEDMREIEELYNQARGNEEKQASTIDPEMLPRKAQNYLNRAKRKLLRNIRKTLGVPQAAMQENLQGVVDEIVGEYLNSGTVSDKKLGEFFDKAYTQGLVTDREFYDQYKHIKDHLRTTAVTLSERDRADIADFNDFRKRQFGRLRIVNQGGLPVDTAYDELRSMAPELFPEDIAHPADQLVHMAEVARSIEISKKTLDEYAGPERETFRAWAKNDFDVAVGEIMGDLHAVRRFADERAARAAREKAPATPEEAMEAYKNLKKARRIYERAAAKNLLTQHDEAQVGRLLRHEIELEHLDPEKDNVKGITAVYEAKVEYERLCKLITEYKRHIHGKLRTQADQYLKTANEWKDKKVGIAYARETMRRNIYDIVSDRSLAREINEVYFEPVHDAEAKAVHLKDECRNKVREMNLSRKVAKGNLVSEAHAVQLLGEAMDNIRILENTKGRMQHRDGKTLADWRGVVMKLWDENPNLDQAKIRDAVEQFRKIYDNLFEQMNKVRVENGYEPINYRSGYFPHFQPGEADGILAQFGRAVGIDTQVVALPTTITGLTHTFKPGIQWFGNAQERLGFNTAYDAVEGFDKYIEGAASVIFQTDNIQRLRAFATQVRYRTSNEGIQEQVDAVYEDSRLTDEEKQVKIASIYEHGRFALANFVAELDEYTNLLANKKSKYDRTVEALMGRRVYAFLKWWESRVGANMIAGNISSALTNFIPLTQAGAQMDRFAILNGMWKTLGSYSTDDGLRGMSSFLTNRKGSDPLVQNLSQVVSGKLSLPMEIIDQFVAGSVVRGSYYQNLKRGMSESEAMHQADIFAAGVMADRSKGSMPTLMQASNPLFKMFTQFQLEVNNQFSEVFKDLPRNHMQQGILHFALVLFKYFLGALLFNELYEWLVGRRPALDPIGLLIDAGKDFMDPDVGFGEGMKNLGTNVLSELPFSSGLTLLGIETDGGRIPASSAVPDLTAVWDAATDKDMHWKKRLKEIGDEVAKPLTYVIPPFGGNQISKMWKGTKAFIEGGSYSIDAKGNEILQYPVYNDDPWAALGSLFRATLLGKSSLPEAQNWVEGGFDSLGAKETAVYQDMLDGGVSQKEAFGLIQELGAARETDSMTKDEAKRNILQNSDVSAEGKSVAFYGLLASETERGLMDALADTDADPWEVVKTLMAMKDAGKLEGVEKTNAKYDAIIQAALTDEEKSVLVGSVIGTDLETEKGNLTQYAKFKIAIEGGMSVDAYLKFRKAGGDIDDYLDFSEAGLDTNDAVDISLALDELVPLDGKERVSEIQRWRTCVDTFSQTVSQMAALAGVMTDKQYAKVNVAYEYDVSPAEYVTLRETLVKYDANGNGSLSNSEVTDAINSLRGLSKKQKAVLWQLSVSSKSAKNNPYSPEIGEQVLKALSKE